MFRLHLHVIALVASLAPLAVVAQTPAIPDTPAGAVLRAWFDAFASGDSIRILDFYRRYQPDRIPQGPAQLDSSSSRLRRANHVTSSSLRERGGPSG
jgi:hypothetical protein